MMVMLFFLYVIKLKFKSNIETLGVLWLLEFYFISQKSIIIGYLNASIEVHFSE